MVISKENPENIYRANRKFMETEATLTKHILGTENMQPAQPYQCLYGN